MLIIFDLDDTLIDTTGSITPLKLEYALTQMVEAGLETEFGESLEILKRLDGAAESASQTIKEFLEIIDADIKYFDIGLEAVYSDLPADFTVFTLDQAPEVLEGLRSFHQLALVTIGKTDQQLLKLKNAGIDSTIFSKIIISEDRDKKPYYKKILDEFRFAPSQTVVCGDRIKRDLSPAKELGCVTVHMQWGRGLTLQHSPQDADFAIKKLIQLKEIVTNLC